MTSKSTKKTGPKNRDRVFAFLVQYKQSHDGGTPSMREVADACCLSVSTVHYHIGGLRLENRICVSGKSRRNIEIVGGSWGIEGTDGIPTEPDQPDQDGNDTTTGRPSQPPHPVPKRR